MNYRITDSLSSANATRRINAHRGNLNELQERLSSGKRINRPSDDPAGAGLVLNLRTSQTEIEQFKRSAATANQKLQATDTVLGNYQNILDRAKTLVAQGLSDVTTQPARDALATELQSLRERILDIANAKSGDGYLFGGTRQNAPPFDPATALPAATAAQAQYVQIEPGTNAIAVGVTAETVFSDAGTDVFTDLDTAIGALRGTGDAAADRTALENAMERIKIYADTARTAQARVGANMNAADLAIERMNGDFLLLEERAADIEAADFAETAVQLAQAQRAFEATLQVTANGRRSLFDFLG